MARVDSIASKAIASRTWTRSHHGNASPNPLVDVSAKIALPRKPRRRADRGRAMGAPKRYHKRLGPFGETAQPVFLAASVRIRFAPFLVRDLVRVTLMGQRPDQLVSRGVSNTHANRHGQFSRPPGTSTKCRLSQIQPTLFRAQFVRQRAKSLSKTV